MAPTHPDTPELPAALAARFVVKRVLASGGFGTVFLAHQAQLDRPVAIKLLHADVLVDPTLVNRFIGEARVTASIQHPHVVRVFDHGVEQGLPWIAYEYLPGRSLAAVIDGGPMGPRAALRAAAQVARALEAAHALGIMHRDIKPANVMEAGPDTYKVTDFGIAAWTSASRMKTQTGLLLGTPTHIAPELIRGGPASAQSDLYALGVTLFELLSGQPPFTAGSAFDLLRMHVDDRPAPLRTRAPGISPNIESYVAQLLEKEPKRRPATAGEAAARLGELAQASPVVGMGAPPGVSRTPRTARAVGAVTEATPSPEGGAPHTVVRSQSSRLSGSARVARRTGPSAGFEQPEAVPGSRWWTASRASIALAVLAIALAVLAIALGSRLVPQPPASASIARTAPTGSPVAAPAPGNAAASSGARPCDDSTVVIKGGFFTMGHNENEKAKPAHRVHLSPFRLDRYEVTNGQFLIFLSTEAGRRYRAHRKPALRPDGSPSPVALGGPAYERREAKDLPVVGVTWEDAGAYCAAVGKRLPTEAEWERAAGGAENPKRRFPWGNDWSSQSYSNPPKGHYAFLEALHPGALDRVIDPKTGELSVERARKRPELPKPVSAMPKDRTQDGVFGLGGNVTEWCYDRYDLNYYARSPGHDPSGPPEDLPPPALRERVVRGSSFRKQLIEVYARRSESPRYSADDLGFRCACDDGARPARSADGQAIR